MDFEVTYGENRIEIKEISDKFVREIESLPNAKCEKKLKETLGLRLEIRWIAKIEYTVLKGVLEMLRTEPELKNCLDIVEQMEKWVNERVAGEGGFMDAGE